MENRLYQELSDKVDGLDQRVGRVEIELGEMRTEMQEMRIEINDMRTSQARSELNINRQLAAIRETQEIIMDIARDSQKLLREMRATLEKYDSDKVAVDVVITDHERRIDVLERRAV